MQRMMILAGVVLSLAGCTTREDRLAEWRTRCERDYGFRPGTEAMSNCLMQQENQRQRRIDAVVASPMPAAPPPAPIYIPPVQVR